MKTTSNYAKHTMSLVGVMMMTAAAGCGEQPSAADDVLVQRTSALHGTATFNFVKTADWGTGYNARVDITNSGDDRDPDVVGRVRHAQERAGQRVGAAGVWAGRQR